MPSLMLLIKPVSSNCNMRCRYCFYTDTAKHRATPSYGVMSLPTMENVVKKALAASNRQCTFAFQGGEPTLAGLDFYKAFTGVVNRHNHKQLQVQYAIQTNGNSIDRDWAAFLAAHHFLVGVSLDGTRDIHDLYRRDTANDGTFSNVKHSTQLFDYYGVDYNILTVVTAQAAKNIDKTYRFFGRNQFLFQQYIPCLDPIYEEHGRHDYSLTPALYGEFLCALFDLWYSDFIRGKWVSVQYFDNLLQMIMGYPPESCGMAGQCSRQIVVEADGGVYPCDFYVLDEFRLGNLNYDTFSQIEKTRKAIGFIETSQQISQQCKGCRWLFLCRGGCRREREPLVQSNLSSNYFCQSYLRFFNYTYPRLKTCAAYYKSHMICDQKQIERCGYEL